MPSELLPERSRSAVPNWYNQVLDQVVHEIRHAQTKALSAANAEMVALYWRIGSVIVQKRREESRYAGVVNQLAIDLKNAYPQMRGLSVRNLHYMAAFAEAWPQGVEQRSISKLPWGHVMVLLDKVDDSSVRDLYADLALEHGWSRNVLIHQVSGALHERIGKAPNTFDRTLHPTHHHVGNQIARDPYMLDFLDLDVAFQERDLHQALMANLARFLQELGVGFAFVGSEYRIPVGDDDAIPDLLFYHLKLRRYIVLELKTGKFQPEYVGQLNYYMNVVDGELRDPKLDDATIGILLVNHHNKIQVEYALQNINAPIAISRYQTLPAEVREALPTEDQLSRAITQMTKQTGTNPPDSDRSNLTKDS